MPGQQNGWNEWSIHVLKELERLNVNYESLRDEVVKVHQDIAEIKTAQSNLNNLKEWKKNMDEVISPTQLKDLKADVDELKIFKTKAVMIWIVLQTIIGIALAMLALV